MLLGVYHLNEAEGWTLEEATSFMRSRRFTTVTARDPFSNRRAVFTQNVALLSVEEGDRSRVAYVGVARRGDVVTTFQRRLAFSDVRALDPPIDLNEVLDSTEFRGLSAAAAIVAENRVLPDRTSEALLRWLRRARPDVASIVDDLAATVRPQRGMRGSAAELHALERDAIAVALRASGVDREVLGAWTDDDADAEEAPFVRGLRNRPGREDPMVWHDSGVFRDWLPRELDVFGVLEFWNPRHPERRVSVMNVNRDPAEGSTGVDLVYYRNQTKSYTLVQYKRLTRRSAEDGQASSSIVQDLDDELDDDDPVRFEDWVCRPDRQMLEELDRMRALNQMAATGDLPADWRLLGEPCFMKFCPATPFHPGDFQLIKGMYLPVSYLDVLLQSPVTQGPRGGRVISYERAGRWLNNTQFIELLSHGWIGSASRTTEDITRVLLESWESPRSLVFAVEGDLRSAGT